METNLLTGLECSREQIRNCDRDLRQGHISFQLLVLYVEIESKSKMTCSCQIKSSNTLFEGHAEQRSATLTRGLPQHRRPKRAKLAIVNAKRSSDADKPNLGTCKGLLQKTVPGFKIQIFFLESNWYDLEPCERSTWSKLKFLHCRTGSEGCLDCKTRALTLRQQLLSTTAPYLSFGFAYLACILM